MHVLLEVHGSYCGKDVVYLAWAEEERIDDVVTVTMRNPDNMTRDPDLEFCPANATAKDRIYWSNMAQQSFERDLMAQQVARNKSRRMSSPAMKSLVEMGLDPQMC